MQPQPLERRVERLEQRVTVLEELPGRIDRLELQFVQLREEMRGEFSALRGEAADEETRRELRDEIRTGDEETRRTLRDEIRAGDEETRRTLRDEIRAGDEETRRTLRDEIRAGDEETRREMRDLFGQLKGEMSRVHEELKAHMLTLYEDIVAKCALFGEARAAAGRKGGRKRR